MNTEPHGSCNCSNAPACACSHLPEIDFCGLYKQWIQEKVALDESIAVLRNNISAQQKGLALIIDRKTRELKLDHKELNPEKVVLDPIDAAEWDRLEELIRHADETESLFNELEQKWRKGIISADSKIEMMEQAKKMQTLFFQILHQETWGLVALIENVLTSNIYHP